MVGHQCANPGMAGARPAPSRLSSTMGDAAEEPDPIRLKALKYEGCFTVPPEDKVVLAGGEALYAAFVERRSQPGPPSPSRGVVGHVTAGHCQSSQPRVKPPALQMHTHTSCNDDSGCEQHTSAAMVVLMHYYNPLDYYKDPPG